MKMERSPTRGFAMLAQELSPQWRVVVLGQATTGAFNTVNAVETVRVGVIQASSMSRVPLGFLALEA